MSRSSNAMSSVPDGPPLATIARVGPVLQVTAAHAATANLLWQQRQRLTEIHNCQALQLSVLSVLQPDGQPMTLNWQRPAPTRRSVSRRRRST